ncbi:unnamed protein product [Brassica oleracea]
MRWRDRFLFCAEAIYKAQAETGEIKGHYLNATAGTCEEMIKRAVFARELGVPIIMHDYLTGGFTANTSLGHYCRDNGPLLHIHRTMHFRVLAKALRLSGGDHIHAGTVCVQSHLSSTVVSLSLFVLLSLFFVPSWFANHGGSTFYCITVG